MEQEREKFSSSFTSFIATLSSAVGLGNIWLFPYVVGKNGGAAFIIVYLLCILLIGLPTLISEFAIGRGTKKNIFGAVKKVSDKKIFRGIGVLGVLSSYSIMFFYTVVAGWVYSYVFKALNGTLKGINAEKASEVFNNTTSASISPIIWLLIVLAVTSLIVTFGVKSGIEKLTKVSMPILIGILLIIVVKSLSLDGAMEGVMFLLKPDFSKITFGTILTALGLAFLKLSLGTGAIITYSSYFTEDNNLIKTAAKVAIADTCVSLLAGLAIFPAVFSFGLEVTSGPGLLFNTVPVIFENIPGGKILGVLFFLLAAMAATMAIISMLEVIVAAFTEEFKISRKKVLFINFIFVAIIASITALSVNSTGAIGSFRIFGNNIFDFFDILTSKVLLPVNSLFTILLCGYFVDKRYMKDQLTNEGKLNSEITFKVTMGIMKYVSPVLLVVILIKSFI